ncbi:LysM peptidoglycan-binding domain-containing protein [Microbacterium sp. Gd 4-13]|uniref:LysM peptidoglycan-binding domain-containing protein n=1 Tax=Microbacterium sp. Gd 4-13 TaxID=2173179 RepID=UPI001F0BA89C|nr:LysM peptidoglycan-binding domain-containing protein [Microbacterium sp. Gd 4-13]
MRRPVAPPALRGSKSALAGLPAALVGALALASAPEAAHAADYTVAPGDTVSGIAARHGLSTADLLRTNGLGWSSIIRPGQKIQLGSTDAAPAPAPTPEAAAPAPPAATGYTIRAGDTISGIARTHGTTIDAVLAANGLDRSSIIYPGQVIAVTAATVSAVTAAPVIDGLDAEQVTNAQVIVRVGRELGVPERGIAIALGTAMQESWLRNLDWGDRDSLGLFQQRPSMGWGSAAEISDPTRSVRVFYGGSSDPNGTRTRGLLDIPGWEAMSYADAAQAVQISAYPERYAQWEAPAALWLAALR